LNPSRENVVSNFAAFKCASCRYATVDDNSIGPEMCADPPEGTQRMVSAEDAAEVAAKIAAAAK
jgi:hypothetical protein